MWGQIETIYGERITVSREKIMAGSYRVRRAGGLFANVRLHENGMWHADIRKPNGDLLQYAGIWHTRREAEIEVLDTFKRL